MAFLEHHHHQLYFEDHGEGRPILLLHSFLCSTEMWRHQIEALSAHHRVIAMDIRGHGRSSPTTTACTMQELVEDALALLDHLGLERVIWAGLSIGGMISMRAALMTPHRVEALIILNSDAGAEHPWIKLRYSLLGLIVRSLGVRPVQRPVLKLMFGKKTFKEQPVLVDEWRERFMAVDAPSMLAVLNALLTRKTVLPRLSELSMPTLLVTGQQDKALAPDLTKKIKQEITHAVYHCIDGAGHLSALEKPDVINTLIQDFITALPAERS